MKNLAKPRHFRRNPPLEPPAKLTVFNRDSPHWGATLYWAKAQGYSTSETE
jgi:hypothetical protein